MNDEPVAWINLDRFKDEALYLADCVSENKVDNMGITTPLYTHPVKEQLSNGHLSDCAIHNEPASKNKDCDCGFEPKFNLADLKHEDNCRYFDDELYCNCGADSYALVEWYRHKEVTHPVKELTETDLILILEVLINSYDDTNRGFLEYEAMYKNSPMRKARIDGMKRMVDKHTHAIEIVKAILRKAQEK